MLAENPCADYVDICPIREVQIDCPDCQKFFFAKYPQKLAGGQVANKGMENFQIWITPYNNSAII